MKKITRGNPFPMGASVLEDGLVQFVIGAEQGKEYSLVLYDKKANTSEEIFLGEEFRIGNLYSVLISGIKKERISYNFKIQGREITDPYAKVVHGNEQWGAKEKQNLLAGVCLPEYDWEKDKFPGLGIEESIIYQLHVRGFTRHSSSGVKKKGTFEGIVEKISYLKDLGVTSLELLPAYEFSEVEKKGTAPVSMEEITKEQSYTQKGEDIKLNYWGYKEAFYFAPKASYSGGKVPSHSFKTMVKELHRENMELIMQFFFPLTVSRAFILEVLKFWVEEYHVDGFRLMGVNIPVELIASMAEFANTKILYEVMDENQIYSYQQLPAYYNLASYNDSYLYSLRKFLKSDVGSLQQAFQNIMNGGGRVKRVVYFTNYNTFTLHDLVSYNRKHNEHNGEKGLDGNNDNVSWNCGVEGETKKRQVLKLRNRQMKNALTLLFLSKGTPVILAGDEFGNTQKGNNNPYCQDNGISWLNWKDSERNKEQIEFCKSLILLRKGYRIFEIEKKKNSQSTKERLPAISFHGKDAWKLDWSAANEESGGILFTLSEDFLYVGINMHWEEAVLALPSLPLEGNWKIRISTQGEEIKDINKKEKTITVAPRSIMILEAKRKEHNGKGITAF